MKRKWKGKGNGKEKGKEMKGKGNERKLKGKREIESDFFALKLFKGVLKGIDWEVGIRKSLSFILGPIITEYCFSASMVHKNIYR